MPLLIIGMPVKDRGWILPVWFDAVEREIKSVDGQVTVEVIALYSTSEDDTLDILKEHKATVVPDYVRRARPLDEIDNHRWGALDTYAYMAEIRNWLIERAEAEDAAWFLSLDSDVILAPGALRRLLAASKGLGAPRGAIVAPAVNMVRSGTAWNVMQWADPERPGSAVRDGVIRRPQSADVIMAALLFDELALRCRWAAHHQGEDIGLCLDAERRGVLRWWLGDLSCEHYMQRRAF